MNNRSFYGLPEKVQFCKKCVISNQRPNSVVEFKNKKNIKTGISFDKNGVCSACNFTYKKNENIDWEKERKTKKFFLNIEKNGYDCLVPGRRKRQWLCITSIKI